MTTSDTPFESLRLRELAADLDRNPGEQARLVEAFWAEMAERGTPLIE